MNCNKRIFLYRYLFFILFFFSIQSLYAQQEHSLPFERSLEIQSAEIQDAFRYEPISPSLQSNEKLLGQLEATSHTDKKDDFDRLFSLAEFRRSHIAFAQNILQRDIENEPRTSVKRSEALLLSAMELLSEDSIKPVNLNTAAKRLEEIPPESLSDKPLEEAEHWFWYAEILRARQDIDGAIRYYSLALALKADTTIIALAHFRRAELYEYELRYLVASAEFDTIASENNTLRLYASLRRASLLRAMEKNSELLQELGRSDSLLKYKSSTDSLLLSPLFAKEEILFLRGSAYSNLKNYDSAEYNFAWSKKLLSNDSLHTAEYTYLVHAIAFEQAWIKLSSGYNEEASQLFLKLSAEDSVSKATNLSEKIYDDYPARSRFYAGIALFRAGKTEEARDILTNLSQDPAALYSDKARYHLALVEFKSGRKLQAEELLVPIAMHRSQSGIFASILLGDIHYRRASYAKAAEYFGFALANLPDNDTALRSIAALERGLSLLPLGSWSESAQDLKLYISLARENTPGLDEALFWLGRAYFRADSLEQARTCFKRILDEFPNTDRLIDAQYGYAWTLFRHGEYQSADREFAKVIEMDSITKYAYDALSRRGDALYAEGNLSKALAIYNLAIDRPTFNDYRTTRSLYQTGVLRMLSDSARSAMNAFKTIFTKFPKSDILDRAYYDYAVAAFAIKKDDEANEALRTLNTKFKDSPFDTKGLYLAASEDERNGKSKEAFVRYKKIIDEHRESEEFAPSLFGAIGTLLRMKKNAEAINLADSFFTMNPKASFSPRLLYRKGEMEYAINSYRTAAKTFRQFISQFPSDTLYPWSEFMLAKTLAHSEQLDEAHDILTKLTEHYSNRDVASFAYLELARLSEIAELDGIKWADAAGYFQKAYDTKYFSSEAAPIAMYEYAEYLSDNHGDQHRGKDPDLGVRVFDELADRYSAETSIGGKALLQASTVLLSESKRTPAIAHLENLVHAQEGYELGAEARLRLGNIYKSEGAIKKALGEFDRAREDNSTRLDQLGRSYIGSAECHIALGDKKTAKRILMEILATRRMYKKYRDNAKELLATISPKKSKKR